MYMGVYTPRANPEECKFPDTQKPRCLTYLNYDLYLLGSGRTLLSLQATRNSAKRADRATNGASFAA